MNILVSGSLQKALSMLEGLQVVTHMPMFDAKMPGNVNAFNEVLAKTVKFDVVESTEATGEIFYVPETDSISLNF